MSEEIEMGDIAKDELTGFEGVVIGRTHWLTNCDRLTLQPQAVDKEGQPSKSNSFDITHCRLVKKGVIACSTFQANMRPELALGDIARDAITGFEGVIIARAKWMNASDRLVLQPKTLKDDGQPRDNHGFDAPSCVLVSKKDPPAPAEKRGGPMVSVKRAADPSR
jgi:hypothetical protein